MEKKLIRYSSGKTVIVEGNITVEYHNDQVEEVENLDYLPKEEFEKLVREPSNFELKDKKVVLKDGKTSSLEKIERLTSNLQKPHQV